MVFCYKTITAPSSPRKLGAAWSSSMTELLNDEGELASIPEREWRLLAALARKRDEQIEREKLAAQFRKMWEKEKEGREMMEIQAANEYSRFIHRKREDERFWLQHRRMLQILDQQQRKGELVNAIRQKERRAQELLAWRGNQKTTELAERVIDDATRALLAAERRTQQQAVAAWKRRLEAEETRRRADDAGRRREDILRDSSRRLAISSALSTWEASFLRHQLAASDAARRAYFSATAARAGERGERLARARDAKRRRARVLAAKFEQWRDAIRDGCY